jgi:beta-phosphoglucomutase-like phosphatase (HAD superfamily)
MQNIKAVLFDLDGTLVKSFTTTPLPGAAERIASLREQGMPIAVCTNQAGPLWRAATGQEKYPSVGKMAGNIKTIIEALGLDGVPWFVSVGDAVGDAAKLLGESYDHIASGIALELDDVLFDVDSHVNEHREWRKPNPGMLLFAAKYLDVDPGDCLYVGDMESDRQAAAAAGMQFEMVEARHGE